MSWSLYSGPICEESVRWLGIESSRLRRMAQSLALIIKVSRMVIYLQGASSMSRLVDLHCIIGWYIAIFTRPQDATFLKHDIDME